MFVLGKLLQAVGIVNVGFAVYVGMRDGLSPSILLTATGLAFFYLGRFIERRT